MIDILKLILMFPVILHTRMDWVYARGQFPVAVQIACPCRSVYVRTDVAPCAHADTATPESTPHVGSGAGAGVPTTTENTQAEGGDRASIATGRVPDAVASRVCAQCNGTARLRPPSHMRRGSTCASFSMRDAHSLRPSQSA